MLDLKLSNHVIQLLGISLLYFGLQGMVTMLGASLEHFVYVGPYVVYVITLDLTLRKFNEPVKEQLLKPVSIVCMVLFMIFHNTIVLNNSAFEYRSYGYVIIMQFIFVALAGYTAVWFQYLRNKKGK